MVVITVKSFCPKVLVQSTLTQRINVATFESEYLNTLRREQILNMTTKLSFK